MIRIINEKEINNDEIFARRSETSDVAKTVEEIIQNVKTRKDEALFEYTARFDKAQLTKLQIEGSEIEEAVRKIDPAFMEVLKEAAVNIRNFHEKQVRNSFIINEKNGVITGQKIIPIEKVGIYVPGGTAAYPSSVLMNAIPARIAGCKDVIMATPPDKDGNIDPGILAAASIAGVDKIFKVGGAQAIAALAYGTESIMKVDKIVGPGNAYVAEAKKQVYGLVSIDMIAGPSEILIIADKNSDERYVAADLLSQAEHDKMASAVLVTDSFELARKTAEEIERQLKDLEREEIARVSIDNNGKIIVTDDLKKAITIANQIAPEHLELCVDDPFDYLDLIKNAGSVFLGRYTPEAIGDYFAGTNHTLPTMGTARFSSPLSVDDFVKKMQYTYYSRQALSQVKEKIALFADKEGLEGHGKSVLIRTKEGS